MVDWSGEAVARPKGLALAVTGGRGTPTLLRPQAGWSRQGLLDWLLAHAEAGTDLLVGLDLSPGLPFVDRDAFFPGWSESPADAKSLWRLVDDRSGASPHLGCGGFLADAEVAEHFRHQGRTGKRFGTGRGRLRICERELLARGLSPSSSFNMVGAAQVGKASLTGMRVLHRLAGRVPAWPFDPLPVRGPAIVEIYTTIAAREAGLPPGRSKLRDAAALDTGLARLGSPAHAPVSRYDDHATDALLTAAWLRANMAREELWSPTALTREIAATEGWTFGVP